jgi:hypothetical protein
MDLRGYIGIEDDHKDDLLEDLVEEASQRIIEYLGYDPHSQTYTDEKYDGDGSHELVTYARPVTSVVAVKLWDGSAYTAIDSSDLAQMQVRNWYIDGVDYCFGTGRSNYAVTYVAGYGDTEIAKRFRVACMKIAAMLEKESGKKGILGMQSQSFGDGSRSAYEDVIAKALDDLTPYRRLS